MPPGAASPLGPTPPTISVVLCSFTLERIDRIAAAIESLRSQTVYPHEILLVVDHSPELEAECRRRWPGIHVMANTEAQGLSGARNTGVAASDSEVVAFLDDDAVAAPDWIERLGAAYADPGVLGAGGAVRPDWEEERPDWFPPEFDWVIGCTHSGMPRRTEAVRNLVGANMSFRREALLAVGGFRRELGRVGKIPAGCEETDVCIRIRRENPGGRIDYEPEATVAHSVPAARARVSYFLSRCRGEGRSKAILAGMVGSDAGLSEERTYTRRTLPVGLLRGLGDTVRGDAGGFARVTAILVGLATTARGYLGARGEARRIARRRDLDAVDPDRLRVLMVTPRSPLREGGVERHVMEVGRRLAAAGNEVEVLCAKPDGPRLTESERDGVRIREVRAWPSDRDWCFAPGLWRQIGRRPWDVIHVQSYHTLVAPLAMLRALSLRTPYVITFHGGGHTSELRNRARRAQRLLLRPLLARAAKLVAVARFEIEDYGSELRLGPERFELIPNGTDLAFAEAADAPPPDGPPTLATIGRLERYKGHDRVIAAMPSVLAAEPGARLLVVGTGPYEEELRRQAEELGVATSVELTSTPPGDPGAMARLLRGVSLVVLMSEFETHPLVALEAASAGRRLLVANASGLAELAGDGLARGVPLDANPEALAEEIIATLDEPPPPPGNRPRLTTWDGCASELERLYRSVS